MKRRVFNKSSFPGRRQGPTSDDDSAEGRRAALITALRSQDLEKAETLLRRNVSPNIRDSDGNTALHIAVKDSTPAAIELLLAHGANPDLRNKDHFTPFLEAVWNKKPEAFLNALLRGGANPNAAARDRKNAMHIAVRSNQHNLLPFLTRAGVNINGRDEDGQTPLHYALFPLRPELAKTLLDLGADAAAADKQGETSLMKAIDQGEIDVVRDVLSRPAALRTINTATTHNTRETALHMAVRRNRPDIVNLLLDSGSLVNTRNALRQTPLFLAFELTMPAMAELLISRGADVAKCPADTRTKRHLIHIAAKDEKTPLLKLLLDHGANINARNEDGNTALNLSLDAPSGPPLLKNLKALLDAGASTETPDKWGRRAIDQVNYFRRDPLSVEAAKMLLERGADPDISPHPDMRSSPLHMATRQEQIELMDMLIQAGADLNSRDRGDMATPLIDAARFNCQTSVNKLLASGANTGAADGEGRTALHMAVFSNHNNIVSALLDAGADPNAPDNLGQTPLLLAFKRGYTHMANAMIAKGARIDTVDKDGGTILHAAAEDSDNVKRLPDLLKKASGIDINAADLQGDTPLLRAVKTRHEPMAMAFLKEGADATRTNKDGETALMAAVRMSQVDIVRAIVNTSPAEARRALPSGETPLHLAVADNAPITAEVLINAGADVNTSTAVTRTTPLHMAAEKNQRMMVELLLGHGADAGAVNAAGKTPREIAEEKGHRALVEVFREAEKSGRRGQPYRPEKKRPKPKPPFDGHI